jgi:hypothetical protein
MLARVRWVEGLARTFRRWLGLCVHAAEQPLISRLMLPLGGECALHGYDLASREGDDLTVCADLSYRSILYKCGRGVQVILNDLVVCK